MFSSTPESLLSNSFLEIHARVWPYVDTSSIGCNISSPALNIGWHSLAAEHSLAWHSRFRMQLTNCLLRMVGPGNTRDDFKCSSTRQKKQDRCHTKMCDKHLLSTYMLVARIVPRTVSSDTIAHMLVARINPPRTVDRTAKLPPFPLQQKTLREAMAVASCK